MTATRITDGTELIDAAHYARHGPPHDIWTQLRAESPVHRCEPHGYEPFWAITKFADVVEVSTSPDRFISGRGITVLKRSDEKAVRSGFAGMRSIINTDPPEHQPIRKIAVPEFTPRGVRRLDTIIEQSARELVDDLAAQGERECDFATDVAQAHPLRILSHLLGVSREQEHDILRITNQLFAFEDPEFQRGADATAALADLGAEAFELFSAIVDDRRGCPRDDLASKLANATLGGEPLGLMDTLGYYLIVFTAGHDTTKNALVGGMRAFIDNPDEIDKIRRDPGLIDKAVEEVVRWTSPVNYMKRTATSDCELGGQAVAAGDAVAMFYASANRDEDVFDDPFRFRVDRPVNRNLGFGVGEHFCLGANLARRSQRALWSEILGRVETVELVGEPERITASFVVGLKHLPVRFRFAR